MMKVIKDQDHVSFFSLQNRQNEEKEQESANKVRNKIFIYRWKVLDTKKK